MVNINCAGGNNFAEKRRVEGLPASDDAVVMCNFNTIDKLEQQVFSVWMSILSRVPNSVLWVLAPKGKTGVEVRSNFLKEASHFRVDKRRIIVARRVPKFEHLDRYRYCDMFLDTFIYNAHSTASDALWAFVPLVTFEGEAFQSRVASDLLQNIGLNELVVHSKREFEGVAVRLGKSKFMRQQIRKKLANNALKTPLFDTMRIAKNLERSYQIMWEVKQTLNLSQQNIVVAPTDSFVASKSMLERRVDNELERAIKLQNDGNFTSAGNIYRRLLQIEELNSNIWHCWV